MKEGLRKVCEELSVKISDKALGLIAANADGSVRDALSLLDQCISGGNSEVSREDVLEFLGTSGEEVFVELTDRIQEGAPSKALLLLPRILGEGKDVRQIIKDWIAHYRNLLITKYVDDSEALLNMSVENIERIREQSGRLELEELDRCILALSDTLTEAKWSAQPRILLELCIVRLATAGKSPAMETRESREARPVLQKKAPERKEMLVEKNETIVEKNETMETKEAIPADETGLTALWSKITQDAAAEKGSMSLLQKRSTLTSTGSHGFTVKLSTAMARTMAEDNADVLERLIEKHTGRPLRMETVLAEKKESTATKKTGEHLAGAIGDLLGIDVEVEDFE